jgi:DNA transposition AAA+ family ATPase
MKETLMREELSKAISAHKITQSSVAKAIGVSNSVISQYLEAKYSGDTGKMDRLIRGYLLRSEEEYAQRKFIIPIVKTTVMKNVHEVLRFCHINRKMGMAYGESGIGKTTALEEYVEDCPETILIEADPTITERDMLRDLHDRLIGEATGSVNQMLVACIGRLRDSGRLIIVDEAENMPYKALNTLRRIHDKAHIGIAMVGMPRLRSNIAVDMRNFAQIKTRMPMNKNLSKLEPEDVEEIISAAIPDKSDLWPAFYDECKGIARNLANIIEQALRTCEINKVDLTTKIIRQTALRVIL